MKSYKDKRGWIFFVRAGIGGDTFKAFYTKSEEDLRKNGKAHGVRTLEWRTTKEEAQADLDEYARKNKMTVFKEA